MSNSFKGTANSIDSHVGKMIKARRAALGISQLKLAEKLDVSFQQVQKYEKGVNRVAASRLYKLSKILRVDVRYFYHGIAKDDKYTSDDPLDASIGNTYSKDTEVLLDAFSGISDKKLKKEILDFVMRLSEK